MAQQQRTYVPDRKYDFELKIREMDYSDELYQIRIVSSLNSPYQIVSLSLFLDQNDIILQKIYGGDPLKLKVRLLGDVNRAPLEQTDFELIYLKGKFQVGMKEPVSTGKQVDRTTYTILCVCRQPFKTITTPINEVYLNATISSILQDLASKAGATLQLDSEGLNTDTIDQVLVPRTTLYKAIRYLDERFGIFNGASAIFCQHDNKLYIKNLTSKTKTNQAFTVYQLATVDSKTDDREIMSKSTDGKNFYTYDKISAKNSSNVKFSVFANKERYIMTPKDQLYHVLEEDLQSVCEQNGIIYQNKNVEFDNILEERERLITDPCAYETSETFAVSKMSKYMANVSSISFSLEKNLPILNLVNVGEAVKLITKTVENTDLSGKYILKTSDFYFHKDKDWQCTCKLELIRTNQTI